MLNVCSSFEGRRRYIVQKRNKFDRGTYIDIKTIENDFVTFTFNVIVFMLSHPRNTKELPIDVGKPPLIMIKLLILESNTLPPNHSYKDTQINS